MWQAGATLRCGARASHCGGFSCCGALALGARASVVVAHGLSSCGSRALERRLSSCGARALLLHGMWALPGPGLEPMSPASAGGFLTTAPPGKPLISHSYFGVSTLYLFQLLCFLSSNAVILNLGDFSPRRHWHCLEAFLVVTTGI